MYKMMAVQGYAELDNVIMLILRYGPGFEFGNRMKANLLTTVPLSFVKSGAMSVCCYEDRASFAFLDCGSHC